MAVKESKIRICDECKSEFNKEISEMEYLCPECSSILYGCKKCDHVFKDNRCIICYWNGNSSEYISKIKLKNDKNFQ
jgi:predicted RNA-binding Zn-ribbon protein involved in translation (DUF1610 family)